MLQDFKQTLLLAYRVSRVRFWLYLGGTYLLGYALGAPTLDSIFTPSSILHLLYFLIPANVFLYGVNDWFDEETDKLNPKKDSVEYKIRQRDRVRLRLLLLVCLALSGVVFIFASNWAERIVFSLFLLLSFFYSAPPFRFKAIPFLDFSSNVLYVLPGLLGYVQSTGHWPSWIVIFALFCWTGAMHLFSAVPDIEYDRKAGITTTAVFLGFKKSLLLCALLWSIFAGILLFNKVFLPWSVGLLLYPFIPLLLLFMKDLEVKNVYWWFPTINGVVGFIGFVLSVVSKLR